MMISRRLALAQIAARTALVPAAGSLLFSGGARAAPPTPFTAAAAIEATSVPLVTPPSLDMSSLHRLVVASLGSGREVERIVQAAHGGLHLLGRNFAVHVGAEPGVGIAHAGVPDRVGEQQGHPAACGAAVAFGRAPGSSSAFAAEPGE